MNDLLRTRDPKKMYAVCGYLYYLLETLSKLPNWKGKVYRGIPKAHMHLIKEKY